MRILLPAIFLLSTFFAFPLQAQFTAGNLAVFRAESATANNTNFSIIQVDPSLIGQTSPVSTISINGTSGAAALRTSGSASSTGYLANSNDGSLLCFTAHNTSSTTGNANTFTSRGVGTLDAAGNFTLAATYIGTSGNQARAATTINNSSWFIADQGGVYSNGTSAASPAGNFRSIKSFGGVVYIFQASATAAPVSTISAATGGVITGLPGLPNGTSAYQDFFMISSGTNGNAFDILYLLSAATATSGTISKYSLVAGTWTANGTYSTSFGGFGLAAATATSSALLYITTGLGANAANSIMKLTDNAGFNSTISITTANNSILYTAPAGTTLKGIAFAPVVSTTPALTTTPSSFDFGSVNTGSSSAGQTFTLTAMNLSPATGSLSVSSSTSDFEIFDGNAWTNNANISYSNGGTTIQDIQVRFTPHTASALPGKISVSGGGLASPVDIAVAGTGINNLAFAFITSPGAAINPPYVSGTINDAADPAANTGVSVSARESGVDIPAANYTITAASSNATVVPVGNITIAQADGAALVKILPAAVGYTDITLTLTKGTDTKTLLIHYAASSSPASASNWPTGIADASAAIALDDNYMIIANDENNLLYVYNRNASGLPVKTFDFNAGNILSLTDGSTGNWKELDLEAVAPSPITASKSYWLGSMSNSSSFNNKPNRDRIMAINTTGTGNATGFANAGYYAGLRQQLINWGDTHGYQFSTSAADGKDSKLIDGFNIEGMAFAPDNTSLYIGFRAPLVPTGNRTKAVIAPLQNFETWFNNGAPSGNVSIGTPGELDLGGRGIRDMVKLTDGQYIIVAGSYDGVSRPALYRWDGQASSTPVLLSSFNLTGLNAEAALAVDVNGQLSSSALQVICDDGDHVFYNDGIAAKDLSQDNDKKFSSTIITSSTESLLPVRFEYFTANRNGANVQLNWKTGTTDDAALFDIMRSENGYTYTSIQTIRPKAQQTSYAFTDLNTPASQLYYRIASKDMSGQLFNSTIRIVSAINTNESIRVFPNPVSSNNSFNLVVTKPGIKDVSIYNSAGALYRKFIFNGTTSNVSTEGWAKGYYLLHILNSDGTISTSKILVQ